MPLELGDFSRNASARLRLYSLYKIVLVFLFHYFI